MDLVVYCHGLAIILISAAVSYCFFILGNHIRTQKTINELLFKNILNIYNEPKEEKTFTLVKEEYAKQKIIEMYTLPTEEATELETAAKVLPFKKPSDINFS